ncbi:MAG: hypothetical protein NT049_01895, partial [Planctomycetota bacterium]|nr:hypothetical protein [Planctomycetota bacterium]
VLLVLMLAATVLAATARRSCTLALQAGAAQQRLQVDWGAESIRTSLLPAAETLLKADAPEHGQAQRELQVRWGMLTCQVAAMPMARKILQGQETREEHPLVEARRDLVLGGVSFHLVVADEQAKANVNLLEQKRGRAGLDLRLQHLQVDSRRPVRVELHPSADDPRAAGRAIPLHYQSLDQVFVFTHPSQLLNAEAAHATTGPITLWSSGAVNFKRASRAVLREVLDGAMPDNQIEDLAKLAETSPEVALSEAMRMVSAGAEQKPGATPGQNKAAQTLLTDTSSCHSLWVVAAGSTRHWYRFYVEGGGQQGSNSQGWAFEW